MSRQGPPVGVIIAVVAAIAAGLLVWLIARSGDDGASASTPQPSTAGTQAGAPRAEGERPALPQVTASGEPRGAQGRTGAAEPPTETVVDGVRIRDHRKDRSKPYKPFDPDPSTSRAGRTIKPELTGAIVDRLTPSVRECGKAVPPEARGAKPRAEGKVVIAIKNHQVTVREATVELSDVSGVPLEPIQQCIQQAALGVTAPAGDEPDLEDYPIRISYALP
jgi:hypothetical protein